MRHRPIDRLIQLAALVIVAALIEIFFSNILESTDNRLNDFFVRTHAENQQADPDIVLIDIDERSLNLMQSIEGINVGRWPWPRSVHGELITDLFNQQAKAIIFDIVFSDPDLANPGSDTFFLNTIKGKSNVFFAMSLEKAKGKKNIQAINWDESKYIKAFDFIPDPASKNLNKDTALLMPLLGISIQGNTGNINYTEDRDGVGRRYLISSSARGWKIPSLPARVAMKLGYSIPDQETIIMHWRGGKNSHPHFSYYDIYRDTLVRNRQYAGTFKDKIIIIGSTASGLHDRRATPIDGLHPAVEIVATAIDNLKNQQFMYKQPALESPVITILMIIIVTYLFIRLHSPLRIGIILLAISVLYLAGVYFAITIRILTTPFTPLAFAWVFFVLAALYEFIREQKEKQQTMQMFGRFVDPRLVKELVDGDTEYAMKSRSIEITILFSDIRNFTTMSENRSADEVMSLLNDYFERQVKIIYRHGGTMDKFIGDAIMAFWGAPVDDPDHALHAVEAAVEMAEKLDEFKKDLGGELGDSFEIGIGVHTGTAKVGMLGFEGRYDYTCIGDSVNLASRIEGKTKGVSRVLISKNTYDYCVNVFDFKDHGLYKVKGREQEVHLYEPRRRTQ
ncbi:MAG: adenylate/guanylate cyclase domain-containing protein [Gammaproteobacteria bacterium]|nr:MAG: adenylate/guanylate cyclase domain-containing protein [Gammaproteobacteria bacterium]